MFKLVQEDSTRLGVWGDRSGWVQPDL